MSFFNTDLLSIYFSRIKKRPPDKENALRAGYEWICNAQDVTDDGGVARGYSLIYNLYLKRRGWFPSYPETTGYIIPTIFAFSGKTGNREAFNRAVRMADWECDIQMKNGAIQGGYIGQMASPAIFNTGQVIFGWIQAYLETGNEKYLNCAVKAGEFLKSCQDEDGAWRHNLSDFTTGKIPFYSYNTRTAWALYSLSEQAGDISYAKAALKNVDFTLKQQKGNGFFKNNCLSDPHKPLLHTIAYCIRGILEIGIKRNDEKYIENARKAADQLLLKMDVSGKLAGRFDPDWLGTVNWSCLTGQAQTAIIWGRLFQVTNNREYLNGMVNTNKFLAQNQIINYRKKQLNGGVPGSDPLSGDYGKFQILCWAVKFFMDALMLEEKIVGSRQKGIDYPEMVKDTDQSE